MRKAILLAGVLLPLMGGCRQGAEIDSQTARQIIIHRNLGLAFLEENKLQAAAGEFQVLVDIAPQELLGYANLGLTYLRLGEFEQAEEWLQKAWDLEPGHPGAGLLLAMVYDLTRREKQAIRTLEKTLKKHPNHVRSMYSLAQYFVRAEKSGTRQTGEEYIAKVVNMLPANVAARLQLVELLIRNGRPGEAVPHIETIRQILPELPNGSLGIFQRSLELIRTGSAEQALAPILMFHNLLRQTSHYQRAVNELMGRGRGIAGEPVYRFSDVVLPPIQEHTGIPDALIFTDVTAASGLDIVPPGNGIEASADYPQMVVAQGDYDGDGDQDIFVARWLAGEQASRQFLFTNQDGTFSDIAEAAGISHTGRDLSAVFADYDNDGHLDLFITNSVVDRLYRNTGGGVFRDVGASTGIRTASGGRMAIFADLDQEGDLDLFIATSSRNRLYRNNSDGTFTEIAEEVGVSGAGAVSRAAGIGDFDDDGDMDLFVVNQGASNRYYDNLRRSYFRDITTQTGLATDGASGAVAVGDYNNDGYLDLFVTDLTGRQHTLYRNRGDGTFEQDSRSDSAFESMAEIPGIDAAFFDADNDGFLDLLIAGASADSAGVRGGLWLYYNDGQGKYLEATSILPEGLEAASQVEVADYDNDGDLDILLVGFREKLHLLRNDGGNVNNYLVVRLAGLRMGSSKNNYFGIGAKVEVKAGALYQMRVMSDPIAHFGLGNRAGADVVRVVWTNGVHQNQYNLQKYQTIVENQILKGSCPWLYTWNGREYEFVTDVLWASALGMPLGIMGGEPLYAFPNSTDEYLSIPGEKLQADNGRYSLQFATELWETPYLDQVRLLVVDHPDSVAVFIDEKFTSPPFPPFRIYAVAERRRPVSALDGQGKDVLQEILARDGEYVRNFTPARYQGITVSHDLILDLGKLSPSDSIFLFLHGWVFPTDASINVNTAQSGAVRSIPPSLEVIDENGDWSTVIGNLGFPKGRHKTLVVDLSHKFLVADYRIRIRTNMQIYWDHIFYATDVGGGPLRIARLAPVAADLHYRGFSQVSRETPYSPYAPDYHATATAPKWRDLIGMYTRYGDVLPLVMDSDSKYVIMNAGDELTLEFAATRLPGLSSEWSRDFIFYNDGWLKDGDFNTAHGKTVQPLPFHGMTSYPYGPGEAYPRDREHLSYLQTYNTREVSYEAFTRLLFNQADDEQRPGGESGH